MVRQAGAWERERERKDLGWEVDRIKSTFRFWTNLRSKMATQSLQSLRYPGGTLGTARSWHTEGASEGFFSLMPLEDGDGVGSDWIVDERCGRESRVILISERGNPVPSTDLGLSRVLYPQTWSAWNCKGYRPPWSMFSHVVWAFDRYWW